MVESNVSYSCIAQVFFEGTSVMFPFFMMIYVVNMLITPLITMFDMRATCNDGSLNWVIAIS